MSGPRRSPRRKSLRRDAVTSLAAARLATPALLRLPPREQEVATIIYLHTELTATNIERLLAGELSNSSIRSMLGRLVAKGVLRRRKSGNKYYYSPALFPHEVKERALERVVEDYFEGSLDEACVHLVHLVRRREPEAMARLRRHVELEGPTREAAAAGSRH